MIKLVIFDLDGVLVEAKEIHYETLNQAIHSVAQDPSMVRIQLQNGYLDVKDSTAFPISFQVGDIRDLSTRKTNTGGAPNDVFKASLYNLSPLGPIVGIVCPTPVTVQFPVVYHHHHHFRR